MLSSGLIIPTAKLAHISILTKYMPVPHGTKPRNLAEGISKYGSI